MKTEEKIFSGKLVSFFLYFTVVFNVLDILLSIRYIKYGMAEENNPFMKIIMDMGVIPFVSIKSLLVGMSVYVLYKYRENLIAQIGAYFCFCFYWALICCFYYFFIK